MESEVKEDDFETESDEGTENDQEEMECDEEYSQSLVENEKCYLDILLKISFFKKIISIFSRYLSIFDIQKIWIISL